RPGTAHQRALLADLALRRQLAFEHRLLAQVEHQIEALAALALAAREVDRADLAAGRYTGAMRATAQHIDLQVRTDRRFRTGVDACTAAYARVEVDRILLPPARLERAEPAGE